MQYLIDAFLNLFRRHGKPVPFVVDEYKPVPISKDYPVTILRKTYKG